MAQDRRRQHQPRQGEADGHVGRNHPEKSLTVEDGKRNSPVREPLAVDAGENVAGVDDEEVGQQIAAVEDRMEERQGDRSGLAEVIEDDHRPHDETQKVEPAAARDRRRASALRGCWIFRHPAIIPPQAPRKACPTR